MNNYVKTLIRHMARRTGTELTGDHLRILEYASHYYQRHQVGPLYRNLMKHTGTTRKDVERLFPHGLTSVYAWVGIPIHTTRDACKAVPMFDVENHRNVYLDHSATTYLRDEVIRTMRDFDRKSHIFGNPSSSTDVGRRAYDIVAGARESIATCLHVDADDIIFTSGGTEANNLALKGIAFQWLHEKGHIITSPTEHPSVLDTIHFLEEHGFEISYADVDSRGIVDPQSIKQLIRHDTRLVSIMMVNNEIGTINPITEIGSICGKAGVPFMVDGVQAFGRIPLNPRKMGINMLSISGHKIYGPKGIGALLIDSKYPLVPLFHGGKQELGYRSGTENVGAIHAFGKAAKLITAQLKEENGRIACLKDRFLKDIQRSIPDSLVFGSGKKCVPHILNIGFRDVDSGALLLALNQIGVSVSSGSACSSGSAEVSHVLRAIGADTDSYGAIRFSFGLKTTQEDLDYVVQYLPEILNRLKNDTTVESNNRVYIAQPTTKEA